MELCQTYSFLDRQVQFISICIASCTDQLHLQTCERMIRERIDSWGLWTQSEVLRRQMRVREGEIILTNIEEE